MQTKNTMKTQTAINESAPIKCDNQTYVARRHEGSEDYWFALRGSAPDSAPEFPEIHEDEIAWGNLREA
jgi:hypothetical protein